MEPKRYTIYQKQLVLPYVHIFQFNINRSSSSEIGEPLNPYLTHSDMEKMFYISNDFNRHKCSLASLGYSLTVVMLRLHWTTFSLRPYHVLKIQERGEDGVKMKQFRISKFPLRPYYVPATSVLRPQHVLTTSFTFPLRPQYALTKFIPFPLRPCYVLTKTKQFIPRANYVSSTF